jgi:hypothetical protein
MIVTTPDRANMQTEGGGFVDFTIPNAAFRTYALNLQERVAELVGLPGDAVTMDVYIGDEPRYHRDGWIPNTGYLVFALWFNPTLSWYYLPKINIVEHEPWSVWPYLPPTGKGGSRGVDRQSYNPK